MIKKIIYALLLCVLTGSAAFAGSSYAYPVPFVRKQDSFIYFKDLPVEGTIRIFTINGDKVAEIPFEPTRLDPLKWDVTNSSGKTLATGVYFYEVESSDDKTVGKLVVIQ